MRRALLGVALVALVVFGAACDEKPEAEPTGVLEAGDSYVVVGSDPDQGDLAVVSGVVELVGDCLGIDGHVAFWPTGTAIVSTEPVVIDVPDVGRVSLGDRVDGGGGWHEEALTDPEVPQSCPGGFVTFRAG